jgi:methionine-rich copper-binding protein CopC
MQNHTENRTTARSAWRSGVRARGGVAFGIFVSFVFAGLGVASTASAHDALESSTPASGSVITTDPGEVTLNFSDDLITLNGETNAFAVQVTDPAGAYRQNGCVTVTGSTASTLVMLGEAGTYTVLWQVVSSDGHPTSGTYTFDYQAPADAAILPGVGAPPACGELWAGSPATDVVTVSPTASSEPTEPADGLIATPEATVTVAPISAPAEPVNGWLVLVLVVAGLGVVGAVVAIIVRKTRNDPFATPTTPDSAAPAEPTIDSGSDPKPTSDDEKRP